MTPPQRPAVFIIEERRNAEEGWRAVPQLRAFRGERDARQVAQMWAEGRSRGARVLRYECAERVVQFDPHGDEFATSRPRTPDTVIVGEDTWEYQGGPPGDPDSWFRLSGPGTSDPPSECILLKERPE